MALSSTCRHGKRFAQLLRHIVLLTQSVGATWLETIYRSQSEVNFLKMVNILVIYLVNGLPLTVNQAQSFLTRSILEALLLYQYGNRIQL